MVMSINGRITNGKSDYIYDWTSQEDKDQFFKHITKAKLIVMGSSTFLANKQNIKPNSNQLRIVLTRNPKEYSKLEIPGQLEFRNFSPKKVVEFAFKNNYKELLLLGGGVVNSAFLKSDLVDQIVLTVEPLIFGEGKILTETGKYSNQFELKSLKKLNKIGTILLTYEKSK